MPAKAGIQVFINERIQLFIIFILRRKKEKEYLFSWMPAFAGMTDLDLTDSSEPTFTPVSGAGMTKRFNCRI
jgi:hypothetical protein